MQLPKNKILMQIRYMYAAIFSSVLNASCLYNEWDTKKETN